MVPAVDPSYRLLAAQCIDAQAKQLVAQLDGVCRAADAEYIHRARVASRRLRAALAMFEACLPDKRAKRWRKSLRRVTRGLGPARDKDVQIEFLCGHLAALTNKDHGRGVSLLLAQVEQEREAAQPSVLAAIERFRGDGVLGEMLAMSKAVSAEAMERRTTLQSPFVLNRTRQAIVEKFDELCQYEDSLDDPKDLVRHHAMRIAAKRLRYTMEIAAPAHAGRLDDPIAAIKKIQTMLGTVHDCDVWTQQLMGFRTTQRKRIARAYGTTGPYAPMRIGIEHLQRECRKQRRRVFRDLGKYWKQWRQQSWLPRKANSSDKTGSRPEGDHGSADQHDGD
jgi:CHAD domain-containing protein